MRTFYLLVNFNLKSNIKEYQKSIFWKELITTVSLVATKKDEKN